MSSAISRCGTLTVMEEHIVVVKLEYHMSTEGDVSASLESHPSVDTEAILGLLLDMVDRLEDELRDE